MTAQTDRRHDHDEPERCVHCGRELADDGDCRRCDDAWQREYADALMARMTRRIPADRLLH